MRAIVPSNLVLTFGDPRGMMKHHGKLAGKSVREGEGYTDWMMDDDMVGLARHKRGSMQGRASARSSPGTAGSYISDVFVPAEGDLRSLLRRFLPTYELASDAV